MCGEQIKNYADAIDHYGSSPRVRGTDMQVHSIHLSRRFIPACAGNRPEALPYVVRPSVHPRVCGEQGL